jgi:hypothetical protein
VLAFAYSGYMDPAAPLLAVYDEASRRLYRVDFGARSQSGKLSHGEVEKAYDRVFDRRAQRAGRLFDGRLVTGVDDWNQVAQVGR